jgi:dipeptidyl aminopeptidase/acylaminoacyl peptidase
MAELPPAADTSTEEAAATEPGPGEAFLDAWLQDQPYSLPSLSPNGRYITYFEESGEGEDRRVRLIVRDLDAPPETAFRTRSFGDLYPLWHSWASDDRLLVAVAFGIENRYGTEFLGGMPLFSRVVSVDRELTEEGVALFGSDSRRIARSNWSLLDVVDYLPDDPDHILMAAHRGNALHLWRVNLLTGDAEVEERGNHTTRAWFTQDGVAVMRFETYRSGRRIRIRARSDAEDDWDTVLTMRRRDLEEREEEFVWAGQGSRPGEILVLARPEGHNFTGIHRYDLETGVFTQSIAEREDYDIADSLIDPQSGEYRGYAYVGERMQYDIVDPLLRRHYEALTAFFGDQIELFPVDSGGSRLLLRADGPVERASVYIYDADQQTVDPVFSMVPALQGFPLQPMAAYPVQARDGLTIPGFITWPASGAGPETPLVVYPHGGPEARDRIAFDPMVQYLASLGYAVYQPNFRGSTGYGHAFMTAGHGQWGMAMQDDIADGVRTLIRAGEVDPERICLLGFSYGGYAALSGVIRDPDLYQCAFAGSGVYDLPDFLDFKSDDDGLSEYWTELMGDPDDPAVLARLEAASPRRQAARVSVPVLLYHGENDRTASVDQARNMSLALEEAGIAHTYIEEEGVGHNWSNNGDTTRRLLLNIRDFLADAMDGRVDSFVPLEPEKPEGTEPLDESDRPDED